MNVKKIISLIVTIIIFLFIGVNKLDAKEVNVYMFYGDGCPHCESAYSYLQTINNYKINIIRYEVFNNSDNMKKLNDIADYLDVNVTGVPFVVINNKVISGYSENVTNSTYMYNIKLASKDDFVDKVGIKLGVVKDNYVNNKIEKNHNKKINIFNMVLSNCLNLSFIWLFFVIILIISFTKRKVINKIIYATLVMINYILYICLLKNYLNIVDCMVLAKVIISLILLIFGAFLINYNISNKKEFKLNNIITYILLITLSIISTIIIIYTSSIELSVVLEYNLSSLLLYLVMYSFVILLLTIIFHYISKLTDKVKYKNVVFGIIFIIFAIVIVIKPEFLMLN